MRSFFKDLKAGNLLLLSILVALFFYVAYRAYNLSFTCDEALSFNILLGDPRVARTANNHWLNTLLMYISYTLFGGSEFSLRFLNLTGYVLYAIACCSLLWNKRPAVIIAGITFLLLNPYLLDFFSLARGYGLALGFFMMSLVYLFKAAGTKDSYSFLKNAALALFFSIGACFSNLSYVNTNLILLFMLFLLFLSLKKHFAVNKKVILSVCLILFVNACILTLLVHQLLILKEAKELYFGGYTGFFHDTVEKLVMCLLYFHPTYSEIPLTTGISWFITIVLVFILIYALVIRKINILTISLLFLSLMVISAILQHLFLDTPFPTERTSLVYIPLAGLCLFSFFEILVEKSNAASARLVLYFVTTAFFLIPLTFNFIRNMNLSYCLEWRLDRHIKESMNIIDHTFIASGKKAKTSLTYGAYMEPAVSYYKTINSMDFLTLAGQPRPVTDDCFLLLFEREKEQVPELDNDYTVVKHFEDGIYLFKRNERVDDNVVFRTELCLKAANNKYLSCEGQRIAAKQDKPSLWESFSLMLFDTKKCALKSYEGFYLCADESRHEELVADRKKMSKWEQFRIVYLGNNVVAFKADNNKYLSLDEKTLQVFAKSDSIGSNEKFIPSIISNY